MRQALGHDPQLLEIVEIPFEGPVPLPDQPENWLIQTPLKAGSWKSLGNLTLRDMPALLDKPAELWHDPKAVERRVREGFPRRMAEPASLYLIRPEKIESIEVWAESNTYPGASSPVKRKRVLTIRYTGVRHECDIDDPLFAEKYFPRFPSVNDATLEITLAKPNETFICVSLTGSYYGHHYKIAAAFFEPVK
ncbi:MAG TPA: hypothetical protein VLX11_04365 [Candidatus Acidoferrales bacterium]|nr:hypothetical protein [Candidatus Acidoferrales bacterium]